jgi:hypothetical protein
MKERNKKKMEVVKYYSVSFLFWTVANASEKWSAVILG